jgi:FMN phosphatase YigB (HAD superfamily)
LPNLARLLLDQVEGGRLEEAAWTVELINSRCSDPHVCTKETLDALQKAKVLATIQRSHIQRQLRSLQARRLFDAPSEGSATTWRIDG